jgi:hypothetical protein
MSAVTLVDVSSYRQWIRFRGIYYTNLKCTICGIKVNQDNSNIIYDTPQSFFFSNEILIKKHLFSSNVLFHDWAQTQRLATKTNERWSMEQNFALTTTAVPGRALLLQSRRKSETFGRLFLIVLCILCHKMCLTKASQRLAHNLYLTFCLRTLKSLNDLCRKKKD